MTSDRAFAGVTMALVVTLIAFLSWVAIITPRPITPEVRPCVLYGESVRHPGTGRLYQPCLARRGEP